MQSNKEIGIISRLAGCEFGKDKYKSNNGPSVVLLHRGDYQQGLTISNWTWNCSSAQEVKGMADFE